MSKYNAKKVEAHGLMFDSQAEADYYNYLRRRLENGTISELTTQPVFMLQEGCKRNGKTLKAITYKADFKYIDNITGKIVVVDVKGMATEVANIKRKMFLYLYGENMDLLWVVKNKKYGDTNGWVDYDLLKKLRAKAKKNK